LLAAPLCLRQVLEAREVVVLDDLDLDGLGLAEAAEVEEAVLRRRGRHRACLRGDNALAEES
jgi:hypothetical protein